MSISRCEEDVALSLVYTLFQAQWDRCDQQSNQNKNDLVKGHRLNSGK